MALQHVEWQIDRGRSVPFDVIQRHRQLRPIAMAALTFEMLLASGDVAFLRQLQLRDTMPEDPWQWDGIVLLEVLGGSLVILQMC